MPEKDDNQMDQSGDRSRIQRRSSITRRGRDAADFVRGLARQDADKAVIGLFKQLILEALGLLKSSRPQEAAFKISDAMLHLPPEKRINRGGIAEWGLEWCQGHLTPIRADGGFLSGLQEVNHRDPSNLYNKWGIQWDHYELLIPEILNGSVLHPYLPDGQNTEWRLFGEPTASDATGKAPRSLISAILILMRLSEDTLNLSPHHPRLNLALGLIHASLAHDQEAYKGIHAVIDGLRSRVPPEGESLFGGFDQLDDFFSERKGGYPPFPLVPEETWDLITTPHDRAEWARRNDEMAVRYLSEAILYSPYQTMFHIHMALGVCLTRLGRSHAVDHLGLTNITETVRPRAPVPMEYFFLEINGEVPGFTSPTWFPYGSDIERRRHFQDHLNKTAITIGRSKDNDITLPDDPLVSRRHAELSMEDGVIWIKDLDSENGTYLNDEELTTHHSESMSKAPVPLFIFPEDESDAGWSGLGKGSVIDVGGTRFRVGGHQSAGGQTQGMTLRSANNFRGHPQTEPDPGVRFGDGFPGWCSYWSGALREGVGYRFDSYADFDSLAVIGGQSRLDRLVRLRHVLDELASGNSEAALVNTNEAIEAHEEEGLPVPFELYHLRSEIYLLQGDQSLSENDLRLADQVLALEFR